MIDGQVVVTFQPFIDTATGCIAGIEALGRLRHADGQLHSVGPLFVDPKIAPSALRRLDREIREQALQRFAEAPKEWFLSINISPRWISRLGPQQPLPSLLQMQRNNVCPSRVVYEITELSGGSRRLPEIVSRYRNAGARVAIDDFGAGYSQIDRVLTLQPDIIKLDMRLFQEAARGGHSSEVVKALGLMAEKTGCWIIAEGVETAAELEFALECGARYVQGYLFAKPSVELYPSDAFVEAFATLRQGYVSRKLSEHIAQGQMRQRLAQIMEQLCQWANHDGNLQNLPDLPWLLRLYRCDTQGNQITPNFERSPSGWVENSHYLGHNWSWRPYFYQLLAQGWDEHSLMVSTTYRDATTNQYCLTAGKFIADDQTLLLMDIDSSYSL